MMVGLFLAAGLAAAVATLSVTADVQRDSENVLAFTHVTVTHPTGEPSEHGMTVVVRGDRIEVVGRDDDVKIPQGAMVVDATGQYMIPGLWDAHAHLSYPGECSLNILVASGVTSVRDLGGPPIEGVAWKRAVASGRRVGPRIYLAGLNIESAAWMEGAKRFFGEASKGRTSYPIWDWSPRFVMNGPEDAGAAVDTALGSAMDVVKFRNLPANEFRALAAETGRRELPLAGHAPDGITLAEAAEAGLRSLEHGQNLDGLAGLSAIERADQYRRIRASGMFVTPTLVSDGMWAPEDVVRKVIADHEDRTGGRRGRVSQHQLKMWEAMLIGRPQRTRDEHERAFLDELSEVRAAHQAGVELLAGTDLGTLLTSPGTSLHDELTLLVDRVGLTPGEALRSATVNPARFFGLEGEVGRVAVGMRADVVLLRRDPLHDIRNARDIEGVVVAGRYLPSSALAALRQCKP